MLRGRAIHRTLSCRRYTQIPTAASADFVTHYYSKLNQLLGLVQSYKDQAHFENVSPREMQSLVQEFSTMDHTGYVWQKVNHEVQNSPFFLGQLTQWFELHRLGLARYAHELSMVMRQATSTQQVCEQIDHVISQQRATTWNQKMTLDRLHDLKSLLERVPGLPFGFLKQAASANLATPMSKAEAQKVSRLAFIVDCYDIKVTLPVYQIAEKLEILDSPSSHAGLEIVNDLVRSGVLVPTAKLSDYTVSYLDSSFRSEVEHLAAIRVQILHRPFADYTPKDLIMAIQQSIQREPWHERAYDILRVLRKLVGLAETMPQGQWLHELDVIIQGGPSISMNQRVSMSRAHDLDTVIRHPRKFNEDVDKAGGRPFSRRSKRSEHGQKNVGGGSGGGDNFKPENQPKRTSKETKPEYVQIPEKLYIHNEIFPLQVLHEYLSKDFSECTAEEILAATKSLAQAGDNECDEADANRLYSKLYRLFAVNGGDTQCLDAVLLSHDHFRSVERGIRERSQAKTASGTGTVFIGELDFPQFTEELRVLRRALGDKSFSAYTSDVIVDTLQDEIYLGKHSKLVGDGNVFNYVRLLKRLERLFALNGGETAALDKIYSKSETVGVDGAYNEYRQIPDDFAIHEFVNELSVLAKEADVSRLGSLSAAEVLDVCQRYANSNPEFFKLHNNLRTLFSHNGNNTAILDAVINSKNHFDSIEASISDHQLPAEYKQLADDVRLDEFSAELQELLEQLDVDKFAKVSYSDVLDVTANLALGSVVFSKLYSNLARLFATNGGYTEILDVVLTNVRAFKDMESKSAPEAFARTSDLLNSHAKVVSSLINEYKANHPQATTISPTLFNQLVTRHLEAQPNSEPLKLVNQLVLVVDYYPNLLQQLLEIRGDQPTPQWSAHEVEEIYKAFMSVLEYDQDMCDEISYIYRKNIAAKQAAMTSTNSDDWRNDYNDSERLVSLLSQQKSPVDFDLLNKELGQDELFIKDAVSIALNQDTERSRVASKKNTDAPPIVPNPSTLHRYLESAHHQHQTSEQSRVREQRAYEWATANKRNHDIPVEFEFRSSEPKLISPLYPARLDPEYDYKLVMADGHSVPSNAASIGPIIRQPVAQALKELPPTEVGRFMEQVHHHERQGWKVVGSQEIDDQPVLILARIPGAGTRSSWGSTIRNLLAVAGGGFLVMLGVDYFVEDRKISSKDSPTEAISELRHSSSPPPLQPAEVEAATSTHSILSNLLWANPPKDD